MNFNGEINVGMWIKLDQNVTTKAISTSLKTVAGDLQVANQSYTL